MFGGTWVQIKDKFVVAAGDSHTVGTQYGRKTINLSHSHTAPAHTHTTGNHTLTINEMPAHNHTVIDGNYQGVASEQRRVLVSDTSGQFSKLSGWGGGYILSAGGSASHNHGNTGSAGASATTASLNSDIDITPLSVAAYCWKRTE